MTNRLKHYRVSNGRTQQQAAKAAGVTQPTYQRWEAGKVDIPALALMKLAKYLKASEAQLLGRYVPAVAMISLGKDDPRPERDQYYGEIAVHFKSGREPLVLSISEADYQRLYRQLQSNTRFITFEDMGNRSVAIRRKAISEFYLSSDSYDWYGPQEEHDNYNLATPIKVVDPRFWEMVEALYWESEGGGGTSDFSEEDIAQVEKRIMVTEEQWEKLVADGSIKAEDLEAEKSARAADTAEIYAVSHTVTIALSSGKRRDIGYTDCDLYECWEQFDDIDEDDAEGLIRIPVEGYHQTVFVNPSDIDFVSFPTHKIEADSDEVIDEMLVDDTDASGKVVKLP
jgi:transcriptional regulator with XRE-family HTH domain